MIVIRAVEVDGVLHPSQPYPGQYIAVHFDGVSYRVYEPGDEVPDLQPVQSDPQPLD